MDSVYHQKLRQRIEKRFEVSPMKDWVFPRDIRFCSLSPNESLEDIEIYDLNSQNRKPKEVLMRIQSQPNKMSFTKPRIEPRDEYLALGSPPKVTETKLSSPKLLSNQPKRLMGHETFRQHTSSIKVASPSNSNLKDFAKIMGKQDTEPGITKTEQKLYLNYLPFKNQIKSNKKSEMITSLSLSKLTPRSIQVPNTDRSFLPNQGPLQLSKQLGIIDKSNSLRKMTSLKNLKPMSHHEYPTLVNTDKESPRGYLQVSLQKVHSSSSGSHIKTVDPFKRMFQAKKRLAQGN